MTKDSNRSHTRETLDFEEFIEYIINEGHKLEYPLATQSLLLAATFTAVQSEFEDGYGSIQDLPYLEKYGLLKSRIIKSEQEIENEQLGEDAQVGEPYYDITYLGYMMGEIAPAYLSEQMDKFNGVNALSGLNPEKIGEVLAAAGDALLKVPPHLDPAPSRAHKALERLSKALTALQETENE